MPEICYNWLIIMKEAALNGNPEPLQSLEFLSHKCPFASVEAGSSERVWPQWVSTWRWDLSLLLLRYLTGMLRSWNDSRQTGSHISTSLILWLWTFMSFRCQREIKDWPRGWTWVTQQIVLNTSVFRQTHHLLIQPPYFWAPYVRHWWLVCLHLLPTPFASLISSHPCG